MPALIAADLRPVMGLLFPPLGGRRRQTKHQEDTWRNIRACSVNLKWCGQIEEKGRAGRRREIRERAIHLQLIWMKDRGWGGAV